jgi:hypothetical protein
VNGKAHALQLFAKNVYFFLIGVAFQNDDHNKCSFSSRTKFVFVGARGSPAAKTA